MLYGLIIALPVTGTAAMYLSFRFAPLHSLLSWALLAVALAHVAAALWHHIYRRDDVLLRMIGRAS
jgi:cytochrome b561